MDSSEIYFSKAASLGLFQFTSADTINLRLTYLKRAIQFRDVDSFCYYLSEEYRTVLSERIESQKYILKSFRAKIKTHKYDELELGEYLDDLLLTGKAKQSIRIYKHNNNGDTVIFKGNLIKMHSPNFEINYLERTESDMIDSIKSWKANRNLDEDYYGLMAEDYFYLGKRFKARLCIKRGLKKVPNSGFIHCDSGRLYLREGKYKLTLREFEKSSSLGYSMATDFLPLTRIEVKIH